MDTNTEDTLELFNLKSSVKIPATKSFNLKEIMHRAQHSFRYHCKLHSSYLTVADPNSSMRFIIFKKGKNSDHSHVNCTGVRNRKIHEIAIHKLCQLMCCKRGDVHVKFDNLSGRVNSIVHHLSKNNLECINLNRLASILDQRRSNVFTWRFNPEIFSSIVFTYREKETCLLYNSGKLTIAGSSSIDSMIETAQWMSEMLKSVLTTTQ